MMRHLFVIASLAACSSGESEQVDAAFDLDPYGVATFVVNGSFENDYSNWTLLETPDPDGSASGGDFGTYGIVGTGQTVAPNDSIFDFFDSVLVAQQSVGLPITYNPTDGTRLALQLQNGPQNHRMFQTLLVPPCAAATLLRWDMMYTNHDGTFDPTNQFFAVNVRDVATDAITATPYKTTEGVDPPAIATMTAFSVDFSAFEGRTIRLDLEHQAQAFHFDIAWDNIRLDCTGAPQITVDPTSLDFATQRVNTTSNALTFDIDNPGTAPLTITSISAGAPFATPNTPIVVPIGGSTTISVTFTPTVSGTANDNVTIISDAATSPTLVPLTGVGIEPLISVAPTLAFGDRRVGNLANLSLSVTNTGSDTLRITELTTSAPFGVTTNVPIVLAPTETVNLNVTFLPSAAGGAADNLSIVSDAGNGTQLVELAGNGVEPLIVLAPQPILDFGNQRVGTTSLTRTVDVTNPGSFPLSVDSVTSAAPFAVVAPTGAFVVQPSSTVQISVTFSPTTTGGNTGGLTVTHDATGSPTQYTLFGTGTLAALDVAPTTLTFNDIRVDTTSPAQPVTVANVGNAPLTITAITPPAGYTVSGHALPVSLLPSSTVKFDVAFAPTAGGAANGALTFVTSVGSLDVTVAGNAVTSALQASLTTIDFGSIAIGEASVATMVNLINVTSAPITIGAATASDPQYVFDPPPSLAPIPPGGSTTFAVRFVPAVKGATPSSIDITLDGNSATEITISVTGQGVGEDGGCCSTGSDGGSSFVFALLFLPLLRRRRR